MTYRSLFIIFVFLSVALFHSALIPGFQISGNYEFTKVLIFTFATSFFSIFFLWKEKFVFYPFFFLFFLGVFISTSFSFSPFLSLIGGTEKGHGLLFFFALFLFANILFQLSKKERRFIEKGLFFLLLITCVIALKERFLPSYDYGNLSGRAFGTLGHPSYLSGVILFSLPFFFQKLVKTQIYGKIIAFLFVSFTLFLTLQWLAIFLYICYFLFIFGRKYSKFSTFFLFLLALGISSILLFSFPEKFRSFISRFLIWQTTLNIIFSSPKVFFFGVGPEMLGSIFSSYKTPFLYIFENFGFTADRTHNIFLDYWVQFGIFPFSLAIYGVVKLVTHFKRNPYYEALILILLFQFFNFPSILTYLLFFFFVTGILPEEKNIQINSIFLRTVFSIICFGSILCIPFLYFAEVYTYQGNYEKASKLFPLPAYFLHTGKKIPSFLPYYQDESYYQSQVLVTSKKEENCLILTDKFPSVENYFFCGDVFKNIGKDEKARHYYTNGIQKLPDLWNKDSPYWNSFFIQHTVTKNIFSTSKFLYIEPIFNYFGISKEK